MLNLTHGIDTLLHPDRIQDKSTQRNCSLKTSNHSQAQKEK